MADEAAVAAGTEAAAEGSEAAAKPEGTPAAAAVKSWTDDLGELKSHPAAQKFKSPADLLKSYVNLEKTIGKDKIALPGKDAKPEEIKAFFAKLGVPESPDGYKLPDVKLPESAGTINPNVQKEFLAKAHEIGLTPQQVSALYEWQAGSITSALSQKEAAAAESVQKSEAALRKEFGRAYDEKISTAKKVIAAFGDDGMKEVIAGEIGNNPAFVRFLAKIGSSLSESGFKGVGGVSTFTMTPEMAKAEIHRIYSDKNHPHNIATHPAHKAALEQMKDLHHMAYAG